MISEKEANELILKLIELKKEYEVSQDNKTKTALDRHENTCVQKFKYLITMKTGRYKSFSNYDDLNQEGFEALFKALKTYNPKKGSFFSWAHHYIGTRISRSANLHTTIRYPLKFAKENTPHRETIIPVIINDLDSPDKQFDLAEVSFIIKNSIKELPVINQEIINLAYGIEEEGPYSINKICKKLNVTRTTCINALENSLELMKENIHI